MNDIFDKCTGATIRERLFDPQEWALAMELFTAVLPPENMGPHFEWEGRSYVQFSSNDYLGLASHPEVRARTAEIVAKYGISLPMGSRLLAGNTEYHLELERRLAVFKRCEAAVTFSTGMGAMMGVLGSISDGRDLLILDERAHASLRCGARISGASQRFFRHNDMEHLDQILQRTREVGSRAVVVDGVYSMDGDVAPFAQLAALKREHGFRLFVDDAHGTGVFGEDGRGTAAHFGAEEVVDLHLGTFSKAMGTHGGFVAGDSEVIRFICGSAPTFLFTKAMPLATVVASQTALELLQGAHTERAMLWANTRLLQQSLAAADFDIGHSQSPITPLRFPGNNALGAAEQLREEFGIWTSPVLFPAVPAGMSLLRLVPTARHDHEDIQLLVRGLMEVRAATEGIVEPEQTVPSYVPQVEAV